MEDLIAAQRAVLARAEDQLARYGPLSVAGYVEIMERVVRQEKFDLRVFEDMHARGHWVERDTVFSVDGITAFNCRPEGLGALHEVLEKVRAEGGGLEEEAGLIYAIIKV